MKRSTWIILFIFAGLVLWFRSTARARQPVQGDGAWVNDLGGKETVLPNYSGL